MKTVTIAEVKSSFEGILDELDDSLLIVESDEGEPLALVASVRGRKDTDPQQPSSLRTLSDVLNEARERMRREGGIPADEFWRQLEAEYAANGE